MKTQNHILSSTLVLKILKYKKQDFPSPQNNLTYGLWLRNWCFWTTVLEKTLASPLDSKEIKPVNPKGIFTRRNDAEAPIRRPPDGRPDSLEKTLLLGKSEGRSRGQQRMRWLDGITSSTDMSLIKLQEIVQGSQRAIHDLVTEQHWPLGKTSAY